MSRSFEHRHVPCNTTAQRFVTSALLVLWFFVGIDVGVGGGGSGVAVVASRRSSPTKSSQSLLNLMPGILLCPISGGIIPTNWGIKDFLFCSTVCFLLQDAAQCYCRALSWTQLSLTLYSVPCTNCLNSHLVSYPCNPFILYISVLLVPRDRSICVVSYCNVLVFLFFIFLQEVPVKHVVVNKVVEESVQEGYVQRLSKGQAAGVEHLEQVVRFQPNAWAYCCCCCCCCEPSQKCLASCTVFLVAPIGERRTP